VRRRSDHLPARPGATRRRLLSMADSAAAVAVAIARATHSHSPKAMGSRKTRHARASSSSQTANTIRRLAASSAISAQPARSARDVDMAHLLLGLACDHSIRRRAMSWDNCSTSLAVKVMARAATSLRCFDPRASTTNRTTRRSRLCFGAGAMPETDRRAAISALQRLMGAGHERCRSCGQALREGMRSGWEDGCKRKRPQYHPHRRNELQPTSRSSWRKRARSARMEAMHREATCKARIPSGDDGGCRNRFRPRKLVRFTQASERPSTFPSSRSRPTSPPRTFPRHPGTRRL